MFGEIEKRTFSLFSYRYTHTLDCSASVPSDVFMSVLWWLVDSLLKSGFYSFQLGRYRNLRSHYYSYVIKTFS